MHNSNTQDSTFFKKAIGGIATVLLSIVGLTGCLSGSSGGGGSSGAGQALLSYPGVTAATPTSTACVTINFAAANSFSQTMTGVNIYASARGGPYLLKAAGIGTGITSYPVCGLLSGTTYSFRVNPLISGVEYANFSILSAQTISLTSTAYNNVALVQAFGPAPNAPNNGTGSMANPTIPTNGISGLTAYDTFIQPVGSMVVITWLAFTGANSSTQYSLVRTSTGATLDATTTTPCSSSLLSSCLVCNNQVGTGNKTCTDTNVAASPQTYDYTVVEYAATNWPEETPSTGDSAYRLKVPIPPKNMALVQRDAANYVVCTEMQKASNPLLHQSCAYTGLGASTYASNPGKTPLAQNTGYYDFGYDLFVDRWPLACNWTRGYKNLNANVDGTFVTPLNTGTYNSPNCSGISNADAYNCTGSGAPASAPANSASAVYFDYANYICYYNNGGTWTKVANLFGQNATTTSTNDPGAYGGSPALTFGNAGGGYAQAYDAYELCSNTSDSYYGKKRLLRMREYIPASEFQSLAGDPTPVNAAIINSYSSNGSNNFSYLYAQANSLVSSGACNSNNAGYIDPFSASPIGSSFENSKSTGRERSGPSAFGVIGSSGTRNCVSRFGIQDLVGSMGYAELSDLISCPYGNSGPCVGIASPFDTANLDLVGFQFDGSQGPLVTNTHSGTMKSLVASSVISNYTVPLGIPLVGNDNGNAISISSSSLFNSLSFGTTDIGSSYSDTEYGGPQTSAVNYEVILGYGYRLSFAFNRQADNGGATARCVLPAD
jgi:hypothetical protein